VVFSRDVSSASSSAAITASAVSAAETKLTLKRTMKIARIAKIPLFILSPP
jgi:hypothetical protein